jgi:hypothetical protein
MERRNFFKNAGVVGLGAALGGLLPRRLLASTDTLSKLPAANPALVGHTKRILTMCNLKAGEVFALITSTAYDSAFTSAMLTAAGEIGASGAHIAVFPKYGPNGDMQPNLNDWHWQAYSNADLMIATNLGNTVGAPGGVTAYGAKVGKHSYRTDMEFINRGGSKTRWLDLGYDIPRQRRYFPTVERKERCLKGAKLLDATRGEIRVVKNNGTDLRMSNAGRPGHAQYGYSDVPGKWDNFGYGCVAVGPVEESWEGTMVLSPGDIIVNIFPQVLEETVKLTFRGGYATSIEGGRRARELQTFLGAFNNKESFGGSHFGWGIHENTVLASPEDVSHYHHNKLGTLMVALGMNFAHGLGGPEAGYSGLGNTTRRAPNHSHLTMHGADVYVGGRKVIEAGRVAPEAGGI